MVCRINPIAQNVYFVTYVAGPSNYWDYVVVVFT